MMLPVDGNISLSNNTENVKPRQTAQCFCFVLFSGSVTTVWDPRGWGLVIHRPFVGLSSCLGFTVKPKRMEFSEKSNFLPS